MPKPVIALVAVALLVGGSIVAFARGEETGKGSDPAHRVVITESIRWTRTGGFLNEVPKLTKALHELKREGWRPIHYQGMDGDTILIICERR